MQKIYSLLIAALVSLTSMAATANITPTWEANYRTDNNTDGVPTGWNKVTTSDAQFEVRNSARLFVVQTWTISHISQVDSLTFVYERVAGQSNDGDVSMWLFPYSSMVESKEDFSGAGMAFLNDVKDVLGVYPGNTIDEEHAPFKVSASVHDSVANKHYRIVSLNRADIDSLKKVGTLKGDYLTFNVLLNTYQATQNYKFYHKGAEAAYCHVEYNGEVSEPAIFNANSFAGYDKDSLAAAVRDAEAGDLLILNEDVTISGARLEIKKALTIQGATGAERIISDVPYNTLMVLANDNTADYTVTFKNLIVDGQNVVRDRQLFDLNGKAKMAFDGVSVINTTYTAYEVCDIKTAGSNVVLSGLNSFPAGIALNKNKRVDHQGATHTEPIRLVLSGDYAEDYAVVLNCKDSTLYTAVDAADEYDWTLYVANNKELKGKKAAKVITGAIYNKNARVGYDSLALAVEEAKAGDILLLYKDVTVPARVQILKALTIQGATGAEKLMCATATDELMFLANDTIDYTVTFSRLTVDGQNAERTIQLFDNNNKAKLAFDNVTVSNTSYAEGVADVKCAGGNIILSGLNTFPAGIALNKNKRIDHQEATHTAETPVKLVLAADYAEGYAIVLHCTDSTLYTAVDAAGAAEWELYVGNGELLGRKVQTEGIENTPSLTGNGKGEASKLLRNGQLFIIRDDKTYTITGVLVD
ncbi:MAG: hypothetical protein IJ814_01200 [Paludibacteraceae bacterium]|nr:hypothetical protein [Paludibacteraceae bacterium]